MNDIDRLQASNRALLSALKQCLHVLRMHVGTESMRAEVSAAIYAAKAAIAEATKEPE